MDNLECFECGKKLILNKNYEECEYCGKLLCASCGVYRAELKDDEETYTFHICSECYEDMLEKEF